MADDRRFSERPRDSVRPGEPEAATPPSSRFDNEEFLFHLYRGSELLQDNCVGEAKEELERALSLQPRDAEGQALLGVVYFRLGLYPRAIQIYEDLIRYLPGEATPRVNLALCYLKTGQLLRAREVLEEVILIDRQHRRAWGYLGLVFERLGELAKAEAAFERAGQPQMAGRVRRMAGDAGTAAAPSASPTAREELRQFARDAEQHLEQETVFARAEPEPEAAVSRSGLWRALELGAAAVLDPEPPIRAPAVERLSPEPAAPAAAAPLAPAEPPRTVTAWLAQLLSGRRGPRLPSSHTIDDAAGFSVRLDALSALSNGEASSTGVRLFRRARGQDLSEPLGGPDATFLRFEAVRALSLGRSRQRLASLELGAERLFVRETHLVGFSADVSYETGRLASAYGSELVLVHLWGTGRVLLDVPPGLSALAVDPGASVVARARCVFGWTGRLLPQALPAAQAPGGARGFVSFSGEGALLLIVDSEP